MLVSYRIKKLKEYVARRQVLLKIQEDEEKLSVEMIPFYLLEFLEPLEQLFWKSDTNLLDGVISLRNRHIHLFSVQCCIRAESLWKGCLSDHFDILHEKKQDQSVYDILFLLILTGKTNQTGNTQLGRVLRHKSASMCGFGSLGLYLACRFLYTKEDEV